MRGMMQVEPLYHQTVAGNKTQTRRTGGLDKVNEDPEAWEYIHLVYRIFPVAGKLTQVVAQFKNKLGGLTELTVAHYRVGEVLYMKEPFNDKAIDGDTIYKFDGNGVNFFKWQNKMFMPASAARVFIQITGICCERLMDISDEDCIAEGIEASGRKENGITTISAFRDYAIKKIPNQHPYDIFTIAPDKPKRSYLSLYRFANKLSAKKDIGNPWVWVYTYKLIDKP